MFKEFSLSEILKNIWKIKEFQRIYLQDSSKMLSLYNIANSH